MLFRISNNERKTLIPPCKGIRFSECGNFCWWNGQSWALESRIQLKESGILLTIGIQNSSSTDKNWNPVPGIRNPQRGIQNPRLSWISLYGVILNTLKCILPTSFRSALVCNYPALCSLYASRVGFETVRILMCGCFRIAYYCCSLANKEQAIQKKIKLTKGIA